MLPNRVTVCCGLELGSSGDCQALKKWTERQIDLFGTKGLQLHQIRIKNPGQARSEFLVPGELLLSAWEPGQRLDGGRCVGSHRNDDRGLQREGSPTADRPHPQS